jgi:prophage regulatory protein
MSIPSTGLGNVGRCIARLPLVLAKTGLSRTTVWRLVRKRAFPMPIPLSLRAVGWDLAEIDKWLEGRAARRGAEPNDEEEGFIDGSKTHMRCSPSSRRRGAGKACSISHEIGERDAGRHKSKR